MGLVDINNDNNIFNVPSDIYRQYSGKKVIL